MVRSPPQLIRLEILPFRMRMVMSLLEQITVMEAKFQCCTWHCDCRSGWSGTYKPADNYGNYDGSSTSPDTFKVLITDDSGQTTTA
jgi:hypothetical protein